MRKQRQNTDFFHGRKSRNEAKTEKLGSTNTKINSKRTS
jgi:hypothetical protein